MSLFGKYAHYLHLSYIKYDAIFQFLTAQAFFCKLLLCSVNRCRCEQGAKMPTEVENICCQEIEKVMMLTHSHIVTRGKVAAWFF